ncbi:hypothetical protein ACUUL3_16045 [Thiovibrio sp. JS02]
MSISTAMASEGGEMGEEQVQRVFVRPDKRARVRCYECGLVKEVTLANIADLKPVMQVKCVCSAVFPVKFESRKFYRKGTSLEGTYRKRFDGDEGGYLGSGKKKTNCRIENVSMLGAGFTVFGRHLLQPEDQVCLGFTLDDPRKTRIEKNCVVRVVDGNYIGVEFDEPANVDKAFGFYLMP